VTPFFICCPLLCWLLAAAADPLYFDFISFSQYATISREMASPAHVFEEYYELCPPGASDVDPCEVRRLLLWLHHWCRSSVCIGLHVVDAHLRGVQ
jgi:hypothetical protein